MNKVSKDLLMVCLSGLGALSAAEAWANDCEYNREVLDRAVASCGTKCYGIERMKEIVAESCGYTGQTVSNAVSAYDEALGRSTANGTATGAPSSGSAGAPRQGEPPANPKVAGTDNLLPDEGQAFQPLDPKEDHAGKACQFFTRPAVERAEMSVGLNYYSDGAHACYGGQMYICRSGIWTKGMQCSSYEDSWKYDVKRLEGHQN